MNVLAETPSDSTCAYTKKVVFLYNLVAGAYSGSYCVDFHVARIAVIIQTFCASVLVLQPHVALYRTVPRLLVLDAMFAAKQFALPAKVVPC